jgi:hypothetical protein
VTLREAAWQPQARPQGTLRGLPARWYRPLHSFLTRTKRAPASSVLVRAFQMPLTLAAYGCIDYGVFTANTIAGWIVTGISLMVLELQLADPE